MEEEKRLIDPDVLFAAIERELDENRRASFTVTGMSMWPFLCHGRDRVIVEKYAPERLKKGDIVLLRTPLGNYLLHRITTLGGDDVETTGDGNGFRDGRFPRKCILARACAIVRKGKEISCDAPGERMLSALWCAAFPVRGVLLRLLKRISAVRSAARKKDE